MRRIPAIFSCLLLISGAVNAGPVVQIIAVDRMAYEDPGLPEWGIETQQARSRKAAFQVWRSGPAALPLRVNYWVGGTASNGVDYVALPGHVTIPAGSRCARIIVHPLRDTAPEWTRIGTNVTINETVVLTLRPSKAYHIGPMRGAKVFIRDYWVYSSGGVISVSSGYDPIPPGFTNWTPIVVPVAQP